MYDIITFGSATRDVYMLCKDMKVVEEKKFITGKGIVVSLGSKVEVEDIQFHTGGGGTNAAATFSKQGFKVAWCGMVGDDPGGREIFHKLHELKIDTRFAFITNKKPTNYSVVLCPTKQDRTILVYHGASSELSIKDIPWKKLQARWFYLAPLSGKLARVFPKLVNFAVSRGIKIAANPGNTQLKMPIRILKPILAKIDILFLNQEEAFLLCGSKILDDSKLLKLLKSMTNGIVVVTKGPEGAVASDGKWLWTVPILKTRVVDRVGAGDAFGAGFVSEYMRSEDTVKALQFGIANSSACLSKWGAKEGVFEKGQSWRKVKVAKEIMSN